MKIVTIDKATVTRDEWNKSMRSVLGRIGEVCQGLVASSYIRKDAIQHANAIIIGYIPGREFRGKQSDLLGGFLIANESEYKNFLYIDVVCSNQPGVGEAILKAAEQRARDRKLNGLVLSALPHVVGYYRRLGYKNRDTCMEEDPNLTDKYTKFAEPLISKYKKNVAQHIYTPEGADYRRYLDYLRKTKLSKNKNCINVADCNKDGYVMSKCFVELQRTSPTASPRSSQQAATTRSPRKSPTRPKTPPTRRKSPTRPKTPPTRRKTPPTRRKSPIVMATATATATAKRTRRPTKMDDFVYYGGK